MTLDPKYWTTTRFYRNKWLAIVQCGSNQNVVFEFAMREISVLPTLKASRELKIGILQWNFCHNIIFILIIHVPNFKAKRFTKKKIFEIY